MISLISLCLLYYGQWYEISSRSEISPLILPRKGVNYKLILTRVYHNFQRLTGHEKAKLLLLLVDKLQQRQANVSEEKSKENNGKRYYKE